MTIPFPNFTELLVYVNSGGPSLCRKHQDGGEAFHWGSPFCFLQVPTITPMFPHYLCHPSLPFPCSTYIPTCAKHQSLFPNLKICFLVWLCSCVSYYDRLLRLALNPQKIKSIIKYSAAKLNKLKVNQDYQAGFHIEKKSSPKVNLPWVFNLIFPIDGDPVLFSSSVSWTCESGY
jgi:hypothetical protein